MAAMNCYALYCDVYVCIDRRRVNALFLDLSGRIDLMMEMKERGKYLEPRFANRAERM